MKAIIEGKRYDTKAAIFLGKGSPELSVEDPSWWEAGLYKTPRAGRYFLAGEGWFMTRWKGFGEGIIPLDKAEARAWAEAYLMADWVEQIFDD